MEWTERLTVPSLTLAVYICSCSSQVKLQDDASEEQGVESVAEEGGEDGEEFDDDDDEEVDENDEDEEDDGEEDGEEEDEEEDSDEEDDSDDEEEDGPGLRYLIEEVSRNDSLLHQLQRCAHFQSFISTTTKRTTMKSTRKARRMRRKVRQAEYWSNSLLILIISPTSFYSCIQYHCRQKRSQAARRR
jgi:hypothetical protein